MTKMPEKQEAKCKETGLIKLVCLCALLTLFWGGLFVPVYAQTTDTAPVISFFYSSECPSCARMKAFIEAIITWNPSLYIGIYEIEQESALWRKACESARIPVWGVPRLFVDDKTYAGWFETDGDLQYANEYYGYVGYRNQIIAALSQYVQYLIVPEGTAQQSTDENDRLQMIDAECGC